jgi:hypothetical protein
MKKAYKRDIKQLILLSKQNNMTTDDLVDSLVMVIEELLENQEKMLVKLQTQIDAISTHHWIEELWETYPHYLSDDISGKKAVARGLGGCTLEDLSAIYLKAIKNDEKRHQQIKTLIIWGIQNKMIRFNFSNFITTQDYLRLETEKLKGKKVYHGDNI